MGKNEIISNTEKTFEDIKHFDEYNNEFWYARELMSALGYKDWRYFDAVIEKAKIACQNSEILNSDHFVVDNKIVEAGATTKPKKDYKLSRYACYLVAQNANPRLKAVALAQTYFAVKTRQQEVTEEQYKQLSEDERRLYNRNLTKEKNTALFDVAQKSGVENFGKFNNAGYLGLYNETAGQIKQRKGLKKGQDILDYMGSEELGANIFRITQTEAKLNKSNINDEKLACATHNYVGKAVRRAIEQVGGTVPENLPTPDKSIKELEKEKKKRLKLQEKNTKKLNNI